MRALAALVAWCFAAAACAAPSPAAQAPTPVYGYRIVASFPHDPTAFTQGLLYRDGRLYEGTGLEGRSSIREVRLETGEVLRRRDIPAAYFGEGIIDWRDRLYQLTWRDRIGFIYGLDDFEPEGRFEYPGEGWGFARDDRQIYMSDGSDQIRVLDPATLRETRRIAVRDQGRPVRNLNEMEFVRGEILANVWQTDQIVRIDPVTGRVTGRIDLTGLLDKAGPLTRPADVLNGIAYDAKGDRLFVTGKLWPRLFQIELVPAAAGSR